MILQSDFGLIMDSDLFPEIDYSGIYQIFYSINERAILEAIWPVADSVSENKHTSFTERLNL